MKQLKILEIVITLGGEIEHIVRSRRQRNAIRNLKHQLKVEQMKVDALLEALNGFGNEEDPQEVVDRFMMNKAFIDIIAEM